MLSCNLFAGQLYGLNEFKNAQILPWSACPGIFPGACDTRQFIANVMAKESSVIQVPEDRWGVAHDIMVDNGTGTPQPDRARSRFAGLITPSVFDPAGLDFSQFGLAGSGLDHDFFHALDPVHHFALAAGIELLANARLSKAAREHTGVVLAAIALPTPGGITAHPGSFFIVQPGNARLAAGLGCRYALCAGLYSCKGIRTKRGQFHPGCRLCLFFVFHKTCL